MMIDFLRTLRFACALVRFIWNPKNTKMVFIMANTGMKKLRSRPNEYQKCTLVFEGIAGFNEVHKDRYFPKINLDELSRLSHNTYGYAVFRHYSENGLFPDFYQSIPVVDSLTYSSELQRQTHDLWHTALGKGISLEDEVYIQAFTIGQVADTLSATLITGILVHYLMFYPLRVVTLFDEIFSGYEKGKVCRSFHATRWDEWFAKPMVDLRRHLETKPQFDSVRQKLQKGASNA